MNVISWESGDSTITDFPACADPFLARVVQRVNDGICTHRDGDLLCPACSIKVLDLGHRTVGTALDISPAARALIYVEIAVEEAESVLGYTTDERPRQACALVRRYLAGENVSPVALRDAASAAAYDAAASAAAASAYAAYAASAYAAYADADAEASAYADAAYVAAASAYAEASAAARVGGGRLARAHRIIDRFEELSGVKAAPAEMAVAEAAYVQMLEVAHA